MKFFLSVEVRNPKPYKNNGGVSWVSLSGSLWTAGKWIGGWVSKVKKENIQLILINISYNFTTPKFLENQTIPVVRSQGCGGVSASWMWSNHVLPPPPRSLTPSLSLSLSRCGDLRGFTDTEIRIMSGQLPVYEEPNTVKVFRAEISFILDFKWEVILVDNCLSCSVGYNNTVMKRFLCRLSSHKH